MDGNGRWASTRGLPRVAGHRAGAEALRRAVEAAPDLGIGVLTVYAFSSDNWRRPQPEVAALMKMFHTYLRREQAKCVDKGVRVSVIGRRDRLPRLLLPVIEECESATAEGDKLHLRLAIDYSSRDAILAAAQAIEGEPTREALSDALGAQDVDLLIRTGGEQRLSDFLLWDALTPSWFLLR
jgi:undecaprenyl diphosphate synthase